MPPHSKKRTPVKPLSADPCGREGRTENIAKEGGEREIASGNFSVDILERFRANYGKDIDLTLRPAYRDMLATFGNPHQNLPPVFHVAGTNGKGSTCAFLRAMLEAGGYRVHVYTSPHLVRFHERIRINGNLIPEDELAEILTACEKAATPGTLSYFEAATLAAFVAFARHPADFVILETGLGGRLDATNIVPRPVANLITRLSYDHREYLGDDIASIAREKAGIMRPNVPCFAAAQPLSEALDALRDTAQEKGAPLSVGGIDWRVNSHDKGFYFSDKNRVFDLPPPALLGRHQYDNAGLAIAALSVLPQTLPCATIAAGLRHVEWSARLQRLRDGRLAKLVSTGTELWLDGGHNDSAGEVLAAQIQAWRQEDGNRPKPLYVVLGMLTSKNPCEFLAPFAHSITKMTCVAIEGEALSYSAETLAQQAATLGIAAVAASDLENAVTAWAASHQTRVLICGSLYLAGVVLAKNNVTSKTKP